MLLKLVSTVVPVYLLFVFRDPDLFYTSVTDLRNSMRVRLVNTMLVSSQSNIPASIVSACDRHRMTESIADQDLQPNHAPWTSRLRRTG